MSGCHDRSLGATWQWMLLVVAIGLLGLLFPSASLSAREISATPYPGGIWSPPPATYGVSVTRNIRVRMRDGVQLPVDLYVPVDKATGKPASGKFPILLTRYWYTNALLDGQPMPERHDVAAYFVERGYIYVQADARGTGRSVDEASYLDDRDAYDGVDLVNWAAGLPASDGKVGLVGCSAMGQAQLNMARVLGPNSPVKAMIPACVPADPLRDTYGEAGVFKGTWRGLYMAPALLWGSAMVRDAARVYAESMEGGDAAFDRDWWQKHNFVLQAGDVARSGAAILLWNGWDDVGFGGIELYAALQNAAAGRPIQGPLLPGMKTTGRYQLILGDWKHGEGIDRGIQLQWFETWLKGVDTGLPTTTATPIHVQDRVSKQWLDLASYPFTNAYTSLYLDPTGDALSPRVPAKSSASLRWASEPAERLEYTSQAYSESMRLAGPIAIRINASSSNNNAQIRFELLDLAPNGSSVEISHGMMLASMYQPDPSRSWRDKGGNPVRPYSFLKTDTPIKVGVTIPFEVALNPTMWTIQPGHRLRLAVSTRPPAKDCPTSGGRVGCILRRSSYDSLVGGTYVVAYGGDAPSMISLPLVKGPAFHAVRSGLTPTTPDNLPLPLDW